MHPTIRKDQYNTYLNYSNPFVKAQQVGWTWRQSSNASNGNFLYNLLLEHFGEVNNTIWRRQAGINSNVHSDWYGIKWPLPWETDTREINLSNTAGNNRFWRIRFQLHTANQDSINSSTTNLMYAVTGTSSNASINTSGNFPENYYFAIINDRSISFAGFNDYELTDPREFYSAGWIYNPYQDIYDSNRMVNLYTLHWVRNHWQTDINDSTWHGWHPEYTNTTSASHFSFAPNMINPSELAGDADSTQVYVKEQLGQNFYIGDIPNIIQIPNDCEYGEFYENTGVDADEEYGGGGTKYYLPVAPWGNKKLGMRVWVEGFK